MILRLGRRGPGFEPRNSPFVEVYSRNVPVCAAFAIGCNARAGSWCSGITSASHAEGPGFKSQWVHFAGGKTSIVAPRIRSLNVGCALQSRDSLAERSKAPDSSSGGAIRVGSNPTAVTFCVPPAATAPSAGKPSPIDWVCCVYGAGVAESNQG